MTHELGDGNFTENRSRAECNFRLGSARDSGYDPNSNLLYARTVSVSGMTGDPYADAATKKLGDHAQSCDHRDFIETHTQTVRSPASETEFRRHED